ncbi:MAG: type VI secretion system ATPase TssH [Deltaproteobacteria bacterium]|nr:type VI secretion system ATPase TssH [Deltaproteobacteria bacterium]
MQVEAKTLVRRLTKPATRALEGAIGAAASAGHYEITVEHLLVQLLSDDKGETAHILEHYKADRRAALTQLERVVRAQRSGHTGRPTFSETLFQLIEEAWVVGSLELGDDKIRTGVIFAQVLRRLGRFLDDGHTELEAIPSASVVRELPTILAGSAEATELGGPSTGGGAAAGGAAAAAGPGGPDSALGRFTTNLTQQARDGKIDPVLGRHREIRQVIDILSRRRKNNPVIVGEPGVGKTALVEGLALAIVAGEVPEHLKDIDVVSLDMGALSAGASVRGEFENRLRGVISEVKASPKPLVLFIDEAHMLVGAGGNQGGGDAANLLKPALARGELRTIAATTWAEYKKYFEKDAALERRFLPVKVDEPGEDAAVTILRGLAPIFEKSHGVVIRDEAIVAAARFSNRFISGRQMPDKAIDLLDMTAARVRTSLNARPEPVVSIEDELAALKREEVALVRDQLERASAGPQLPEVRARIAELEKNLVVVREQWEREKTEVQGWIERRNAANEKAAAAGPDAAKEQIAPPNIPAEGRIVHFEVDAEAVAQAVSAWTGIPAGRMNSDSLKVALELETHLDGRVYGQPFAVHAVADAVRMAKSGIRNPDAPVGVLLFVGPTGVGKTETALALADLLYGGERFMTTINMTEFQEKHTVSRLIGSPPGYVGYGEGGVLTEAVRQRPYSVVLLDECEKADLEVMNLFYQVFDKGMLSDGEGRLIDFRNVLLVLTSNLASDTIVKMEQGDNPPTAAEVIDKIRPELIAHFKPALLARMTIVPFRQVGAEALRRITQARLAAIANRVRSAHKIETVFEDAVTDDLVKRSLRAETGARTVDHVLRSALMPTLSRFLLEHLSDDSMPSSITIGLTPDGDFRID